MKKTILTSLLLILSVAAFNFTNTEAAVNKNNGAKSKNTTTETKVNKVTATQANVAVQSNLVGVDQNSGGNKANKNTKGDVTNTSGNSEVAVGVGNQANVNDASLTNCGCDDTTNAKNVGNGYKSNNTATSTVKKTTTVTQTNSAVQTNTVLVNQNSGNNQANSNTGGTVEVGSGDTSAQVVIENTANSNTLVIQ